jgi:hypothetical protein
MSTIELEYKNLQKTRKTIDIKDITYSEYVKNYIHDSKSKLAIIIPFREEKTTQVRLNHLKKIVNHMNNFFKLKKIKYSIFVIQQYNYDKRFNRGMLLNIGVKIVKKYNIIVTHDVDMLPDDYLLNYYLHIPKYPVHIAYPGSLSKYAYPKYIGGINIYSVDQYKQINGYPNDFWGWGGEDDAIYDRIALNNLIIIRPDKGKINELEHKNLKDDKEQTNLYKWENRINNIKTWKTNGLNNLKFQIIKKQKKHMVYIITVKI